jgi:hypothetical protein
LSGEIDGKPKVFRDTAVENLTEFLQRFVKLNIRSNPELDALAARARDVIQGVRPQRLRDSASLRRHVSAELAVVEARLGQCMADRPRRSIMRRSR